MIFSNSIENIRIFVYNVMCKIVFGEKRWKNIYQQEKLPANADNPAEPER